MRRGLAAVALPMALAACGRGHRPRTDAPPSRPVERSAGSFTLHEWGLIGRTIRADATALSSGVPAAPREPELVGTGTGKPVLTVHLDPGVDRLRFGLKITLPAGSAVLETWPTSRRGDSEVAFDDVVATRGACAAPASPPTPADESCRAVPDGFCEAVAIGRYHGDDDVCLTAAGRAAPLLFYRAHASRSPFFPYLLEWSPEGLSLAGDPSAGVTGPMLLVDWDASDEPRLRDLRGLPPGAIAADEGTVVTAAQARALLTREAVRAGLTEREAEAFIDAWATAFGDARRRTGPDESGTAPVEFAMARRSLLYFAPSAFVDALLPLTVTPPPREVRRVFLVRVVDEDTVVNARVPTGFGTLGLGGYGSGGTSLGGMRLGGFGSGGTGSGSGYPASAEAGQVHVAPVDPRTVGTGLTGPQVARSVARNLSQVRHCYDAGPPPVDGPSGRLIVRWSVGPTGLVSEPSVESAVGVDSHVGACVVGAVARWRFPPPDPTGTVAIRYGFEYGPARNR